MAALRNTTKLFRAAQSIQKASSRSLHAKAPGAGYSAIRPLLLGTVGTIGAVGAYKTYNGWEVNPMAVSVVCAAAAPAAQPSGVQRERTFIMVKPDGVHRGLVGEIIQRFEQRGYKLVAIKTMQASEQHLAEHYADLSARPFFPGLVKYMASGPVVPMVFEGNDVVRMGRMMLGATNPRDSNPGTIRGDFCVDIGRNICHGSDSVESAEHEIALWFKPEEQVKWRQAGEEWVYEK